MEPAHRAELLQSFSQRSSSLGRNSLIIQGAMSDLDSSVDFTQFKLCALNWCISHLQSTTIAPFISCLINNFPQSNDDNSMWVARAVSMGSAVLSALIWHQKTNGLLLTLETFLNYLNLDSIEALQKSTNSSPHQERLTSYLKSLPGFTEGKELQSETTREQHRYLQMQFTTPIQLFDQHLDMDKLSVWSLPGSNEDVFLEAKTFFKFFLPYWCKNHPNLDIIIDGVEKEYELDSLIIPIHGQLNKQSSFIYWGARNLREVTSERLLDLDGVFGRILVFNHTPQNRRDIHQILAHFSNEDFLVPKETSTSQFLWFELPKEPLVLEIEYLL